jgi:hypothetical protein
MHRRKKILKYKKIDTFSRWNFSKMGYSTNVVLVALKLEAQT